MNNIVLDQAKKWLDELGIRTQVFDRGAVWVNRDDMVNVIDKGEQESYDEILATLKSELNSNKLFWGGKDDTWLSLDSF